MGKIMKTLPEVKESLLTIKYKPDGETVTENPPRFMWVPSSDEDLPYKLQISTTETFEPETTVGVDGIAYNFYTLDHVLEPGTYYWRYSLDVKEEYTFSRPRRFTIPDDIPETPLPGRDIRYQNADLRHPRIWLGPDSLEEFGDKVKENRDYCGFGAFYDKSVAPFIGKALEEEPAPYPGNKRVVALWRENYSVCQRNLCHVRSLAVAGRILKDKELLEQAKKCLLQLAGWDVSGTTSRNYNDECAFRAAYTLAFGYDWLYDELSEEEKKKVFDSLFARTKEVAKHIISDSRIHFSLYDSHAVRSLSSVLTPCCIAMLGECGEAAKWLDYTIEYFSVVYTPWGGIDGGWAEGPLYWTTGMAFVIEALNTIKSFLGIDLYQRPFFKKTGDFPLYCNPVDTRRACFSDQSNLGKYPGHKTAFNIRQFAGTTGNADYQWYYEQVFAREPVIDPDFFNSGWWDFDFDDMVYRHDYQNTKLTSPGEEPVVKWFRDIGWVAINKNLKDFDNHIFFLTKSSPYGCVSHSHGDQNSFLLHAYGEPLIIRSGHYIGFNTSMHKDWRKQTRSHNNILINGQGQYAGMDKALQLKAAGQILKVEERADCIYIKEDAAQAYLENVPDLTQYTREIYFVDGAYFVLVDSVSSEHPSFLDWRLHSLREFGIRNEKFSIEGEKAGLSGKFVYCSSGIEGIAQGDGFEGVDPREVEGLEKHWHLDMRTGKAKNHIIVTLLVPWKQQEKVVVNAIKDDQGHDVYFYFSHDGNTFSLKADGNKRY